MLDLHEGLREAFGIKKVDDKLKAALERIQELEERLEITHVYVKGDKVEVPPDERGNMLDGIDCRDVTIGELEKALDTRAKQEEKLREALVLEVAFRECTMSGSTKVTEMKDWLNIAEVSKQALQTED